MLHTTYKVIYRVGGFLILRIMTIFEERMTTRLVNALERIANSLEKILEQKAKKEDDKK